ncbi:MAG: hypothetical protein K1060chlam5_00826 [Candidatus Anoxychlamydiales bacterium]|nr:hypothetical protein [Candidatus Anoxychlamydiales bacterium]
MLKKLREEIDKIDNEVIILLEKRFEIVKKIKYLKLKERVEDKNREEEILKKISSQYIIDIYKTIFENSKLSQKD